MNIINDKPISLAPGSSVYKASHHCMSWQILTKKTMADKDISEAIAKLYTRKQEILPDTSVSGELPTQAIIFKSDLDLIFEFVVSRLKTRA